MQTTFTLAGAMRGARAAMVLAPAIVVFGAAFGMLAANFYVNATQKKLSNEDMDNALTSYANSLQGMSPAEREPFDTGCARKYAQMDKLCEVNECPHSAPAAPDFPAPAESAK